ncbi:MAG: PHP domain-containing protein [Armatimonadota bacterium]
MSSVQVLEEQLNSFDAVERRSALAELARSMDLPPSKAEVNLHFHTFFSFNAEGWSPSRVAWESAKYGLEVAGIVDFDVLDGMEEFLAAGDELGLKAIVGLETRVFVKELADKVISSPNEPGIAYFMASGCFTRPPAGSRSEEILLSMSRTARERNLALIERVNAYLDDVQLDYDADIVPLTPAGNVTERHILAAYDRKSRALLGDRAAEFWAEKLGAEIAPSELHEKMRSKLMKFGGVGYVPPTEDSFPTLEEAIEMIRGMDAVPMAAWLDGTNPGEADPVALLDLMRSKGVAALNIIPDRNWNIKDPAEKVLKTGKLRETIEAARALHMPIAVGTEMNKAGLPFVDDFHAPELAPYVRDFMEGARRLYERSRR